MSVQECVPDLYERRRTRIAIGVLIVIGILVAPDGERAVVELPMVLAAVSTSVIVAAEAARRLVPHERGRAPGNPA